MKIEGCKVLVTGANRGIGLAIAKAFASSKASVWLGVRDLTAQASVEALAQTRAVAMQAGAQEPQLFLIDLSSRSAIDQAIPMVLQQEFDILVNNAGQLTGGLLEEQPLDDIYSMFQANLVGLVHLTRAVIPGMVKRGRGKVIMNSSVSGIMNFPMASTYSAAKTGVVAFSACLQNELRGTGVSTLTLLTPGVKTRMFDEIAVKYGAKFDLSAIEGSIAPEDWAEMVLQAVLDDRDVLYPQGATRVGVLLARHVPKVFNGFVRSKFRRQGL